MRAVVQHRYGGPDTLHVEEIPKPEPAAGQMLIGVEAAALNPTDYVVMRGLLRFQTGWLRPKQIVRGFDVAGVVEAVGEGVTGFKPGGRVFGSGRGSLAEYVIAAPERVVPMPERLSFEQAAAIPVAGCMALDGLRDVIHLRPGQRIAITGATGGVGSFAVQIAKAWGAHVTAVCRTENVEAARALGADRVFDRTREDYLAGETYDAIFDNGGGRSLRDLRRALAPGGAVVINCGQDMSLAIAGTLSRLVLRRRDVKQFVRKVNPEYLGELAALAEEGKLTPLIDRVCGLEEAAEGMRRLMGRGARGKIVIGVKGER